MQDAIDDLKVKRSRKDKIECCLALAQACVLLPKKKRKERR